MQDKKYLKLYQKIAYGSGDIAGNSAWIMLSSFLMIYLTNTVGLNSAVIGTLIMVSKLLDGVTDVIFGSFIDRTNSKLGKARPWMLYSQLGVSACLFLVFTVPNTDPRMQYAYFFVVYTVLNAIFYTANNISYGSLVALITKNPHERVQLGSFRYTFALITNLTIMAITVGMVEKLGGGAIGWRNIALIYAVMGLAANTFSCLMVKEIPQEETTKSAASKPSIIQSGKHLLANKFYLFILLVYVARYSMGAIVNGARIYYMTYVLGDVGLLGKFSAATMLPQVAALIMVPFVVKAVKSMWKVNIVGYIGSSIFALLFVWAASAGNITLMLVFMCIRGLLAGSLAGTANALVAEIAGNIHRKHDIHLEGTIYSCSSFGIKLGSAIGSAVVGWLLAAGGFNGTALVQPDSALKMISFLYVGVPLIFDLIITFGLYNLKVEKANKEWDIAHNVSADA